MRWCVVKISSEKVDGRTRIMKMVYYCAAGDGCPAVLLPDEECERTPLSELAYLVMNERSWPPRSPHFKEFSRREKDFVAHPLFTGPPTEVAAVENGEVCSEYNRALDFRTDALASSANKKLAYVLLAGVNDMLDIVRYDMLKKLRLTRRALTKVRKRKRDDQDPEYVLSVDVTFTPKMLIYFKVLLALAGFEKTSEDLYVPGHENAVRLLLGAEASRSFVNPILSARFFEKKALNSESIETDLTDPYMASTSTIYTHGLDELGDKNRDPDDGQRGVFPDYTIRHMLVSKMATVVPPDPRVQSFATVRDDIYFQIRVKDIYLRSSPVSKQPPRHAGSRVSFHFAHQVMSRTSPGNTHMRPLYPSLVCDFAATDATVTVDVA